MDIQGSNHHRVKPIAIIAVVTGLVASPVGSAVQRTPPPDKGTPLIELGLTTNRSKTASAAGGFSAKVLARSGLVSVLYDCQSTVEKVATNWAKKNKARLVQKIGERARLRLVYSSDKPAGNFILEYQISPSRDEVRLSFSFRTLTNISLSGDDVGLDSLGQDLLQAAQCTPG